MVHRGVINVHRVNAAGKVQVIHVFHPGESFAEAALATGEGYPGNARALSSSAVVVVPKSEFVGLLRRRPELALRVLASMGQHLRRVVSLLDDLTLKDAEARCIHWLLRHCLHSDESTPVEILLEHPKRLVAAELNIASETFSRTLARLREKKLVNLRGKTILILDPQRLEASMRRLLGEPVEALYPSGKGLSKGKPRHDPD